MSRSPLILLILLFLSVPLAGQEAEEESSFSLRAAPLIEWNLEDFEGMSVDTRDIDFTWRSYGVRGRAGVKFNGKLSLGVTFQGTLYRIEGKGTPVELPGSPQYKFGTGYFVRYDIGIFRKHGLLPDTAHLDILGTERPLSLHPFVEFMHTFSNATITKGERKTYLYDKMKVEQFRPALGMRVRFGRYLYFRSSLEWPIRLSLSDRSTNIQAPYGRPPPGYPVGLNSGIGWCF